MDQNPLFFELYAAFEIGATERIRTFTAYSLKVVPPASWATVAKMIIVILL